MSRSSENKATQQLSKKQSREQSRHRHTLRRTLELIVEHRRSGIDLSTLSCLPQPPLGTSPANNPRAPKQALSLSFLLVIGRVHAVTEILQVM